MDDYCDALTIDVEGAAQKRMVEEVREEEVDPEAVQPLKSNRCEYLFKFSVSENTASDIAEPGKKQQASAVAPGSKLPDSRWFFPSQ